jgi:hypothetical protein
LRVFRRGHERSDREHLGLPPPLLPLLPLPLLLLPPPPLLLLLLLGWAEAAPQLQHSPTSKRHSKEFSPILHNIR